VEEWHAAHRSRYEPNKEAGPGVESPLLQMGEQAVARTRRPKVLCARMLARRISTHARFWDVIAPLKKWLDDPYKGNQLVVCERNRKASNMIRF